MIKPEVSSPYAYTARFTFNSHKTKGELWAMMRDLEAVPRYVPGVRAVRFTTKAREGIGASRTVLPRGMDETVIDWSEGNGFTLRLHRGEEGPPFPFREAEFRYYLAGIDGSVTVGIELSYNISWGSLGSLLNRVMLGAIIQGIVANIGKNLRRYYEN